MLLGISSWGKVGFSLLALLVFSHYVVGAIWSARSRQFDFKWLLQTPLMVGGLVVFPLIVRKASLLENPSDRFEAEFGALVGFISLAVVTLVNLKENKETEPSYPPCGSLQLRVAFLTNFIPPYSLPVLQLLSTSVKSLRIFISTSMEGDRPWTPQWEGLDVITQKTVTSRHRRKYKQGFSMTFLRHFPYDTLPLLSGYKPDVVVSAQLGFRTLQAIAYRFFAPHSRLVIWVDASEHTEREIGRARTAIRKLFLRAADAVIVNGASGSKYVQGLGVSPAQIAVVPFVSKVEELSGLSLARSLDANRRLLYVGQLIERRGLRIFLQELASWAAEHRTEFCQAWIVGDGPLRDDLEQFPLPPNVEARFFGNIPYAELAPYYLNSGIFVLPTFADTWALVVNEALAAGLPVLASLYSQAAEELIRDSVNGWTFYPDRPEDFRNALSRTLSTPVSVLNQMRVHARKSVQHLTPEYSARQFARAIRIAMESEKGRDLARENRS